jgi:putative NADH-flavin reductase
MKILIFGASGATGQQLIEQALKQHHTISVFVRRPNKIKHKNLAIIHGDVTNTSQVESAVKNQDAVLSALGASTPFKRDFTLIEGIENIVMAMINQHVKRFIYQSFLGVKENRNELGFLINKILPVFLKPVVADHELKEKSLINSGLEWTIVRCAMLTNGKHTGVYKAGEHVISSSIVPTISRADVADFMLRQLTASEFLNKKPRIIY